jgi:hypothetical protein
MLSLLLPPEIHDFSSKDPKVTMSRKNQKHYTDTHCRRSGSIKGFQEMLRQVRGLVGSHSLKNFQLLGLQSMVLPTPKQRYEAKMDG